MMRSFIFRAVRMAASDPRVQAKAFELFETVVLPRARATWARTQPTIAATRDELRAAARTADPRTDPKGFVREVRRRISARRNGARSE